MEQFTFTNKLGNSITIGYNNADFTLLEYDGLTTVEVLPYTHQGYNQYGNTVDTLGIGTRIITIRFLDAGNNMEQIYTRRRNLASVFNPALLGTLEYENDYVDVALDDVEVTTQLTIEKRYGTIQEYEVELTAHSPWFRDTTMTVVSLTNGSAYNLNYTGDVPTPWLIQWELSNGLTLEDPKIETTFTNTAYSKRNDNYVQMDGRFSWDAVYSRKYIGLCSAYGKKGYSDNLINNDMNELTYDSIWKGINIYGHSSFQDIMPGANVITPSTVAGVDTGNPVSVKLKYYKRYSGV